MFVFFRAWEGLKQHRQRLMVLPVYVWARWKSGLACVAYGACFTDNSNLYLTRIGHLILYLLGDFG